ATGLGRGSGPMVGEAVTASVHSGLTVRTALDPAGQPFLDHHRIDGTPVLPGVMGLEAFAETARLLVPGWHVAAIEDVDFRAPVKFHRDQPRTLTVTALVRPDGPDLVADCALAAERVLPGSDAPQRTVHFTGSVRLSQRRLEPDRRLEPERQPEPQGGVLPARDGPSLDPAEVYRLYFHGPAYQVVGEAWRHGEGAAARFATGLPAGHDPATGPTVTGPRLVELCLQAAGLWEAGTQGRLALPLHIGRVRLLADPVEGGDVVAVAHATGTGFDCAVRDGAGRVMLRLEDYRTIAMPQPVDDDVCRPIRSVMNS
ncbi:MAG TPA: polyketide synthase dehydratase domain-containing protein, partial [Micromonosporaceae bacterium]|nr:polyketide synthase dehydratase domain-containing protein [Micromonosporaceae bacterium]